MGTQPESVEREARIAGLKDRSNPTLQAIEQRRAQLWTLTVAVLILTSVAFVLASLWGEGEIDHLVSPAVLRASVLLLAIAFSAYVIEKERHLRKLNNLLIEERARSLAFERRLRDLSALAQAAQAVNSVLAIEDVLDTILDQATTLFEGASGSIMLRDGPEDLCVVATKGNPMARGARMKIGEGVAGHVALTREPLLLNGEATAVGIPNPVRRSKPVHSAMSVPLENRGQLLGVLNISAPGDREFTRSDLHALSAFAGFAAIAVANGRLYEAERGRVEELTQLQQMKSESLTTVGRELRTPLMSVLTGVAALQRPDVPEQHQRRLLDAIESQGQHMWTMIEQLLEAARFERERPRVARRPLDLGEEVRRLAAELETDRDPIAVDVGEHCEVAGDKRLVQQVVWHLLDNAFKHGRPPVGVTVRREGHEVVLAVGDSGRGIPEQDRERIFEGFRRLDPERAEPGLGVGLFFVRELVEAMGGRVWADESPVGGAILRVALPAITTAVVPKPEAQSRIALPT